MVSKEYSTALFNLCLENNNLEEISASFDVLCQAFKENPDYMKILTSPGISSSKKKESIKNVLENNDIVLLHFVNVLIDNDRVINIYEIQDEFSKLVLQHKNILKVTVYSVDYLSENKITELKGQLSNYYNKNIMIDNIIDKTLIAGIKLAVEGKEVDLSIFNKINKLKKSI